MSKRKSKVAGGKSHWDTSSFGKRQEYRVIAELLGRGYDVYQTLVDDKGIDCIIRGKDRKYWDIQIKARSREAKQPRFFAALSFKPQDNYIFIFFSEPENRYWIVPSEDLAKLGSRNKTGKNQGKLSVSFPRARPSKKFVAYEDENGWKLLGQRIST